MGLVYLIHFKTPFKHANHYLGWCEDGNLAKRIDRHKRGQGSKLMRAVVDAMIEWEVVRVWENVERNFERALKNRKSTKCFCPACCGEKPPKDLKQDQFEPTSKLPF